MRIHCYVTIAPNRNIHFARYLAVLFLVSVLVMPAISNVTSFPATHSKTVAESGITSGGANAFQDEDADKPHLIAASYYSVKGNLRAMLKLNNKGALPLEVQPTLYNLAGERFDPAPITIDPTSYKLADIAEIVSQAGQDFEEGRLNLFYKGHDLLLGAQVSLVDVEQSIGFDEQLVEPAMMFSSSRLEGVWWAPSKKSKVQLVLSNTTNTLLAVSINIAGVNSKLKEPVTLTLNPHETRVVDVQQGLMGLKDAILFKTGGISIEHFGPKGSLLARGMVHDDSKGYSSVMEFTDPANAKSSRLHGAGLRLGTLKGEALKPPETLRPVIVAHNVGNTPTKLTGRVPYSRGNGSSGSAEISSVKLQPGEIKILRAPVSLGNDVVSAGLEFEYTSPPGTVVMSAQSVSKKGNQVFRVPLLDPASQKSSSGGYPWIIDETSRTIVYVKNTTDRLQEYVLELRHETGTYTLGIERLEVGQTSTIDFCKLRDDQIKDENGEVIPVDARSGQVHWSLRSAEEIVLIGRSEQVDLEKGLSSTYACQNCCGDNFGEGSCLPGTVVGIPGDKTQFVAKERDRDCYGNLGAWFFVSPSQWSSDNTSVATVNSSGLATAQGSGNTNIVARWTAYVRHFAGPPPIHCVVESILPAASGLCQVQTPKYFKAESVTQADWGNPPCTGGVYAAKVVYKVYDQTGTTQIQRAGMIAQELVTIIDDNGNTIGQSSQYEPFSTPQATNADGIVNDIPIGSCISPPPPPNRCVNVTQLFKIVMPNVGGGSTTFDIQTTTIRRDCQQGIRVTVMNSGLPDQNFSLGTVN